MANSSRNVVEDKSSINGWEKFQVRTNLALGAFPRIAIILGLIVLVATGVFLVSNNYLPYAVGLALLPFLIIGFVVLIYHFDFNPIILLITAAFIPVKLPTGTGSPLVASLILAIGLVVLWILRMMVVDRHLMLKPSLANTPALAFMAVTVF